MGLSAKRETIEDIASLALKLKTGDFCFVTISSGLPRGLAQQNTAARLAWFRDELGDVAAGILIEEVENATFRRAVHKVLITAFQNAFATRRDGAFLPFLQVGYSDSVPMITIGGGLLAPGQAVVFTSHMANVLPFLKKGVTNDLYQIRLLHITERERALFDRAATKTTKRSAEFNQLKKLGFDDSDLTAYKDLIRYLPRYFETII